MFRDRDISNVKMSMKRMRQGQWPHKQLNELTKYDPPLIFKWDWGGRCFRDEIFLKLPVPHLLFVSTGTKQCKTGKECVEAMKTLQARDIDERGLSDLQYNFYIGGDRKIYEGRGWHVVSTKDPPYEHLHAKSIDIAFMGDYSKKRPGEKLLALAKLMTRYLFVHEYIAEKFMVTNLGETEAVEGHVKMEKDADKWIFED